MTLDVGCGVRPMGDVNCDLLVRHDHWMKEVDPHLIRNFVKADVHSLPSRDSSFKIVYSSHLLEHVDEPVQALSEMIRVSPHTQIVTMLLLDPSLCQDIGSKCHDTKYRRILVNTCFFYS